MDQEVVNSLAVDIAMILVAAIALIVSVIALLRSSSAIETQLTDLISSRGSEVMNKSLDSKDEMKMYNHVKEEYCNAFEFACSQYLRLRISRFQFKKLYKNMIINMVESDSYKDLYFPDNALTDYVDTMKVYKKFKKKGNRMEFKEYKSLNDLSDAYKRTNYNNRYELLMKELDSKKLVEIKETKVYAQKNLDVLNRIPMALSLITLMVSMIDNIFLKISGLFIGVGYFAFAVLKTKPFKYIEFICDEKINELTKK